MKTLGAVWMYLACVSCSGQGLSTAPMKIEEDALLKKLQSSLPANWSLLVEGEDSLIVRRKGTVWVLFENRINAPMNLESEEERAKRIQTHGKETACELAFRCEPKWNPEKIRQAEAQNQAIAEQLGKLQEKHDVARLLDQRLSRKRDEFFRPTTPEEVKRVEAYIKEQGELKAKAVRLPEFSSEKHALFLESKSGCEDDFQVVHPLEATREWYAVELLMRDLLPAK